MADNTDTLDDFVKVDVVKINNRFNRIKELHAKRDAKNLDVRNVVEGRLNEVSPDVFPEIGPWKSPIIANMIDVAARDIGEMLAVIPTFNCTSPTMVSDAARKRASTKTKIISGYVGNSELAEQMQNGAYRYALYGAIFARIDADFEDNMPFWQILDPIGCYPERDHRNRLIGLFQKKTFTKDELMLQYPKYALEIKGSKKDTSYTRDVVFYHNKEHDIVFLTGGVPVLLDTVENKIGKCLVVDAERTKDGAIPRGQFDDVIAIQTAKSRLAYLNLRSTENAINAPLILPDDVTGDVAMGPNSVIRSNKGEQIRQIQLGVAPDAWREQQTLDRELNLGARFPEGRSGNSDASIVTGAGENALMDGYDSQVKTHQVALARFFQRGMSLCLEIDEKIFGDMEKTLHGSENGTNYEITYVPSKAIAGDYTLHARYGLMAGLDPNRWLTFFLMAKQAGMFSRDFMMRDLPFDVDVEDENQKIDIEKLSDAGMQAVMGYAQSIPQLAAQGQDVSHPLAVISSLIKDRRAGKNLVDSMVIAFQPSAPQGQDPDAQAEGEAQGQVPGTPGAGLPGGPGQQQAAPSGPPALGDLLASLNPKGQAANSASLKAGKF